MLCSTLNFQLGTGAEVSATSLMVSVNLAVLVAFCLCFNRLIYYLTLRFLPRAGAAVGPLFLFCLRRAASLLLFFLPCPRFAMILASFALTCSCCTLSISRLIPKMNVLQFCLLRSWLKSVDSPCGRPTLLISLNSVHNRGIDWLLVEEKCFTLTKPIVLR